MRALIVILIIVILIYALYRYLMRGWDNVSFNVYFVSADLSGINLQSLIAGLLQGGTPINVVIGADIKNDNNYDIEFSGLKVALSYKGTVIAQTSQELASKSFTIKANSTQSIQDNATITLNKSGLEILKEKVSKQNPQIDYSTFIKLYGIQLPVFRGRFNW